MNLAEPTGPGADVSSRVHNVLHRRPNWPVAQRLCAAGLAAGLSWVNPASGAYLPAVGPSPIRLQQRPKTARVPVPLPAPAPLPDSAAVTNSLAASLPSTPAANTNTVQTLKASSPSPSPTEPPPADSAGSLSPDWAGESATPMLTPQMLVPFFEHRTLRPDGKEIGIIAPLPFVPPRSPGGSSSRAVLRTD